VIRAIRTADGAATLTLRQVGEDLIEADAVGPGAGRALDEAPGLTGALDDPDTFRPRDHVVRELWRRYRGVRLIRAPVLPVLIAAILEQKVTGAEARGAWRGLVFATSERAPGEAPVWLPPDPDRVAATPSYVFHRFGVEARRADVVRAVCSRAARIEGLGSSEDLQTWLRAHRGIGPWTTAETARLAVGDPDAVSVGDFHLPDLVAWTLAGEPRADDARMLELLEPYRGQRGRLQVLLEAGGATAPRYGPRTEIRSIAGL
jgi:3-methyladenine DNA glycosylase/8-oxoguanine DNA glycosylase